MKPRHLLLFCLPVLVFTSCVSRKTLKAEQDKYAKLNTFYMQVQDDLRKCREDEAEASRRKALLETEITGLNKQVDFLKENNNTVLNQLKDLSVISSSQAESIKKSLDNIGAKDSYIQSLQSAIARKDSLNMALVMNLKGALSDINDTDVEIKVEKGVVFISISDKMLFKSGSSEVSDKAMTVLGKVAQVLNSKPEIEFMVEGHTDNVAIKNNCIADNWDLSVKRATSVIRILQNKFNIDPKRMTAGGRGEYIPLKTNDTAEGKAANRRTRIVILPQLDQFFQLLEKPQGTKP
ncbi:OmpA family protein [Flavisolibacter ginsengisoli]|jgi:chemotaxis protein MotB|uniref:Chemotaxis protein MotB n=1 Tax=Flavisolibacter ginsengisoli DSM 18119 TaxID=1121884 RepID=A0A1M5G0U9_9BACT|nr:OmpA family protein [Flavisolibacter ginsengisoli]SHF97348.1 chemotaxis protein MotB [Flavisolibacter ginsengisoli DSM 18119]